MNKIRTILCLAFASAMMACNAGNTSAQTENTTTTETSDENTKSTKIEASVILTPKSDTQIRPDMKVLRPTIIDFNATWCGPCRLFAPAFDKAAEEYMAKADFYSIDTDKYPQTSAAFNIEAIPTIVFITPDGNVERHVGLGDFLTTLTNQDASQEEVTATMTTELKQMVEKMTK